MTPQEIISEVDAHGFADTDINEKERALNAAIRAITVRRDWPFLEKVWTLAFDGTNPYSTTDISDLRAVKRILDTTTGARVRFMRTDDMEDAHGSELLVKGTPQLYYFEGTQLRIWQVPSSTQTLRLRGTRRHPLVSASSSLESDILIPSMAHEAIVLRTLIRLYMLEDDVEMAAAFKPLFDELMVELEQALQELQMDEAEYVHVIDDDNWDYDYIY